MFQLNITQPPQRPSLFFQNSHFTQPPPRFSSNQGQPRSNNNFISNSNRNHNVSSSLPSSKNRNLPLSRSTIPRLSNPQNRQNKQNFQFKPFSFPQSQQFQFPPPPIQTNNVNFSTAPVLSHPSPPYPPTLNLNATPPLAPIQNLPTSQNSVLPSSSPTTNFTQFQLSQFDN